MIDTPELVLVHTTCANVAAAERLAKGLVSERLAACVSVGPEARSVYPWQGQIEIQAEVPLTIKTRPETVPSLKAYVLEHHDYEVPELLVTPVIDGHRPYLDWAREWLQHD